KEIVRWYEAQLISPAENALLLADLMRAANQVANIAGTYGCFLKHWDKRAHRPIMLQRSQVTPSTQQHEVLCADAHEAARDRSFDVIYLDPPYTWRHYGAYYHILETIAAGDKPTVAGRTGLRPWEEFKSRYCDRTDSAVALAELIGSVKCEH